ncbi:MAG: hypothetical protein JXR63_08680 [Spirochaetales bacterium]|nr:hypothetical protein [Spirochaetales bacterium]
MGTSSSEKEVRSTSVDTSAPVFNFLAYEENKEFVVYISEIFSQRTGLTVDFFFALMGRVFKEWQDTHSMALKDVSINDRLKIAAEIRAIMVNKLTTNLVNFIHRDEIIEIVDQGYREYFTRH